MGHARAVPRHTGDLALVDVHAMGEPHVGTSPPELLHPLDRPDAVRLCPALNISREDLDEGLDILEAVLSEASNG